MGNENIDTIKAAAEYLGINYMTIWKIMKGLHKQTVVQCTTLLKKGKFSGNWMFWNVAEIYMTRQANLEYVIAELKGLRLKK